jgi:hypothetical protein
MYGSNTKHCGGLASTDSVAPQLRQFPSASELLPGMSLLCGPCTRCKKRQYIFLGWLPNLPPLKLLHPLPLEAGGLKEVMLED